VSVGRSEPGDGRMSPGLRVETCTNRHRSIERVKTFAWDRRVESRLGLKVLHTSDTEAHCLTISCEM
jgi:hypothetical protein